MLRSLISRVLLSILLLAAPLWPTWSIVVVDLATGEVGVVVATCLEDFNLRRVIPAVVPEIGISAHQSIGDPNGSQRIIVYENLQMGLTAPEIMVELNSGDPLKDSRQIGVASMTGHAATFTGASCGAWAGGLTGQSGTLVYAVQGNVLAGAPVVTTAEATLINTQGSMADRLMAAMEDSGLMGGDGRCSCSQSTPTACGSPPPSFTKSAHAFTMIVARPGDPIGDCNQNSCARGDLYCIVNITDNGANDPDVIGVARQEYDAWKLRQIGRPDAYNSIAWISEQEVIAGNLNPIQIVLDLRDLEGTPMQVGGATISLGHGRWSAGGASLQSYTDHNDGTYTLEIIPGTTSGQDQLLVQIDDGQPEQITIWPQINLTVKEPQRAPFAPPSSIAGLNTASIQYSGHLFADQLTAWRLEDSLGRPRLVESTRPATGDHFNTETEIIIEGAKHYYFNDLWASNDRLRLWLSGKDPHGGPLNIWFTERATTSDNFPLPMLVDELNTGLGDADMHLSDDEMHMVFASKRDGAWDLWESKRWQANGKWLAPVRLNGTEGGSERYPLYLDQRTQLYFARINSNSDINVADLSVDGTYQNSRPVVGSVSPGFVETRPSSFDYSNQRLWVDSSIGSSVLISAAATTKNSLNISVDNISQSSGGQINFDLDASQSFFGADYYLLVSASGTYPSIKFNNAWVPLQVDPWTYWSLHNSTALQGGFQGTLDTNGRATAILSCLPAGISPSLIGAEITAVFVAEVLSSTFVSETKSILILP